MNGAPAMLDLQGEAATWPALVGGMFYAEARAPGSSPGAEASKPHFVGIALESTNRFGTILAPNRSNSEKLYA